MKKTTNNTVVLTETEITSENSKTILLRLHGDQSQVNPAAIPHFLDSENIEFAARLHELPYAQAYSEVVRPSRIIGLTSDNSAASLEIGIANSNPSEGLTPLSNNPLTIPVSDSAPSFLISDNFLESADNRERIIPLPAEELSLESASGFINGFLANILPIPEEAIIGLCQTPSLAADTRNVINALRQDLIDTMNDQTSSRALARFEEFRALQNRIYEQSQLYHLGQPLPQKTYYTLWKFILLIKIF